MKNILKAVLLSLFVILAFSCKESNNNPIKHPKDEKVDEVAKFMWESMSSQYLWEENVPGLQLQEGTPEWVAFVNNNGGNMHNTQGYYKFFESLLYRNIDEEGRARTDRWSWFVPDYVKQEESFAGINKSFGYDFKLSYLDEVTRNLVLYVTHVVPGGSAYNAGIRRGDVYTKVDGQLLTDTNYKELLLEKDAYHLGGMKGKEVDKITAIEKFEENPVHLVKVLKTANNKKVGYLVYNGFVDTDKFNLALNDSIGKLKSEGIDEFVLDLRYNGGGSVRTSGYLVSMIDGLHTGEVYAQGRCNDALQANIDKDENSKERYISRFVDEIMLNNSNGVVKINSLNMKRVYVIVSGGTASASEMVINGLRPYLGRDNVILIGQQTHGKYVASITLYDWLRDANGKVVKNPNHRYAMQPIVMKYANANGVTDFVNGFEPHYIRSEFTKEGLLLKPFGDVNEPLLKTALDLIEGKSLSKELPDTRSMVERAPLYNSLDDAPLAYQMYDNRLSKDLQININK